jgi:oligopeptide/dipeptide ABC transporter ATP-binding protein
VSRLLTATGLKKTFPDGTRAVDGVDLFVNRGEVVGVVGESGCGKSTLARLLLRLITLNAGTIVVDGVDLAALPERALLPWRRRLQLVFQDSGAALHPRHTVARNLLEPLLIHGLHPEDPMARVTELLREVGLSEDVLHRHPLALSGGQRQRVGIARALAVEPELLILDEPVSALDVSVQAAVVNLLAELCRARGLAMVFIAHDLHVVRHLASRVLVLYRGTVVEEGPVAAVFDAPRHPYTRALLDAVPVADPTAPRRTPPPPIEMGTWEGCRYRPRCPRADDACGIEPALTELHAGHRGRCHHPLPLPLPVSDGG